MKKRKYLNPMVKTVFKKKNDKGYEVILEGITWIQEHRAVVEAYIGRKLTKEETIHHLDHNKQNNDINNLMLFPNQKEHKSFENKVRQFKDSEPIRRQIRERWKEYGK